MNIRAGLRVAPDKNIEGGCNRKHNSSLFIAGSRRSNNIYIFNYCVIDIHSTVEYLSLSLDKYRRLANLF